MPQFAPGSVHVATPVFSNPKSAGFDYSASLCMGAALTEMASASFHLDAGQSKSVPFSVTMPSVQGTYPVYLKVTCGGVLINTFVATEDVTILQPQAITSIDIGALTKPQGANFPITIEIESASAGPAWLVFAIGKGQALPGAGLRSVYDNYGGYLGWFPGGFTPDLTLVQPFIGSINLVVGKNTFTISQSVPALYPLGTYITYAAFMSPAANWLQWPNPYDWKMGPSFTVIEPPTPVTVTIIIGQQVIAYSGYFISTITTAGLYGLGEDKINHLSPYDVNPLYCSLYPTSCLILPYMIFYQPGKTTSQIIGTTKSQIWGNIGIGAYIVSGPPLTASGTPAKFYNVVLSARLTYPDGTYLEKSLTLTVPPLLASGAYQKNYVCLLPFGKVDYGYRMDVLPAGQYSLWLQAVVQGVAYEAKTVTFTVS